MELQVDKATALRQLRSIREPVMAWPSDYPDMYAEAVAKSRRDTYVAIRQIFGTSSEQVEEAEMAFRLTDFGSVYRPRIVTFLDSVIDEIEAFA